MGLKVDTIQNPSSATVNLTLDTSGNVTVGGNLTVPALVPSGSSIPTNGIYLSAANTLALSTNSTNRAIIDSSGNLQVGGSTVGNTAGYVNSRTNARAWVTFTGSTGAILAGYNVSSITRNGAGDYTFNFTTALADTNYFYMGQGYGGGAVYQIAGGSQGSGTVKTTSSLRMQYGYVSSLSGLLTNQDPATGYMVIFGN